MHHTSRMAYDKSKGTRDTPSNSTSKMFADSEFSFSFDSGSSRRVQKMSQQRTFREVHQQTSEGGSFTVRETRVVTNSVRSSGTQVGEWKTVTREETVSGGNSDGTKVRQFSQQSRQNVTEQFGQLSIPDKEEKNKSGLFSGMRNLVKPKSDARDAKPISAADFEKQCLEAHNSCRAKHGVPALKLSKDLCKYANEWATKIAKEDSFKHRPNCDYGENIFMKFSSNPNFDITGQDPVDNWYSEISKHVFGREPTSLASGHFSQVVWEASRELGVAKAKTASGKILVVANYKPAGNMIGEFAKNVHPSKK